MKLKLNNLHKTSFLNSKSKFDFSLNCVIVYRNMLSNCEKLISSIGEVFENVCNAVCTADKVKMMHGGGDGDDNPDVSAKGVKGVKGVKDIKDCNADDINLNRFKEHSFISVVHGNGVVEDMIINNEEYLVLKLAVEHNKGIINLLNRRESIKSLIAKRLVVVSNEDGLFGVGPVANVVISNKNAAGCVVLKDKLVSGNNSDVGVVGVSWGSVDKKVVDSCVR